MSSDVKMLEVITIIIHRDPNDHIFVEKYDGVDLTIKLVMMDDSCYSVHAIELLNSLLKSPERSGNCLTASSIARRYTLRYDLDSLFHMLVGLINKHIDNEFYVFQGLYSLSSCIAFGNVKFSIPDLLFLLHKCMKYVCGWTWVLHRHLKTSFFTSTISITAFFSSSPSMFLCALCTI